MKNKAAQSLGHLGGKATSEAKAAAVRENGKKGGRPLVLRYSALLRDGRLSIVGSKREAIRLARIEASDGWPSEAKNMDSGEIIWKSKA